MMAQNFKNGDRVRITNKYPHDRDYPIAHTSDADMWGLIGVVVGNDDKYVFVEPLGLFNDWPRKERFDPLTEWHFLPDELAKV